MARLLHFCGLVVKQRSMAERCRGEGMLTSVRKLERSQGGTRYKKHYSES